MRKEIDSSERITRKSEYVTGILMVITLICLTGFIIAFSIAKKKQLPNLNVAKNGMIVCLVLTLIQMIVAPLIVNGIFKHETDKELKEYRKNK